MNEAVRGVLASLSRGDCVAPEDLIALNAAITQSFQARIYNPSDSREWMCLAVNAAWLGGYSETCVGVLLAPVTGDESYAPWARAAIEMKAAGFAELAERERRRMDSGWNSRPDDVDLYVPRDWFERGRWRAKIPDDQLSPGLRAVLASHAPVLTCQVKARMLWEEDGGYDAISYRYFVDAAAAKGMTRAEFVAQPCWRRQSVDLVAAIAWERSSNGAVTPRIRLLGRDDVRAGILGREQARVVSGKDRALTRWDLQRFSIDDLFTGGGLGIDVTYAMTDVPRPGIRPPHV